VGVLFLTFVALMDFPRPFFLFLIPAVALMTFLNLRNTKFCDACGKTLINQNPFSPPAFCSKCGAALNEGSG
jgi:hypothetical protein